MKRRKREHTRAEIEEFLEHNCPNGSDLEKLTLLIGLVFLNCSDSLETMIARARQRGIRADRINELLHGDVAFGFRWDSIEGMLKDCGAGSAAIQVAHDLFHDFPRTDLHRMPPAATGRSALLERPPPARPSSLEQGRRPQMAGHSRPDDAWDGQNCSVVYTDVAGFSAPTRTDQDRKIIRRVMYWALQHAFDQAGISWDYCHHEDRGDGTLIVVPPDIPTRWIVHPLIASLADGLNRHNAVATDATRFQLRVALQVGPVESDAEGVNGEAIIYAARLLQVPAFKQQLAQTTSCVGLIVSDFVYDSVIKHRPGPVDPASYQKIRSRVKGFRCTAWTNLAQTPQ